MEGEIVLKVNEVEDEIERLSALEGKSEHARGQKSVLVAILWHNGYIGG